MRWLLLATFVSFIVLTGCSSKVDNKDLVKISSVEQMYTQAQTYLDAGRFAEASMVLTRMNSRYPFGPYAQQIQLDLIYALYKIGEQDKALSFIDRFLQLNPNHPDLDYVRYMKGLVYQQASISFIQNALNIERSDRSPYFDRLAFEEFSELFHLFPDSIYAADARARMIGLSSRLAKYELVVAKYYQRRGAHLAATSRAQNVLLHHPNVPEQQEALQLMIKSYQALGLTQQAEDAQAIYNLSYEK